MTVLTVLLAGALLLSKHRRAALFTVLVMVTTSLITTGVKLSLARSRPEWQASADFLETKSFPSGHASSVTAFAAILAVLALMLVRRSAPAPLGVRRVRAARRRHLGRPGDARAALPHRRGRRLAARPRGDPALHRARQPAAARPRRQRGAAARGLRQRAPARGDPQPDQGRGRRGVPRDGRRDGRRVRLVGADAGTTRPSRTRAPGWPRRPPSTAPTWCWCAAATAPCARCAPSWPAPASRSASSRPAPATCWPATSTSRSTSAPPSTSPSTARTGPSTWSTSAATASRTPTSW